MMTSRSARLAGSALAAAAVLAACGTTTGVPTTPTGSGQSAQPSGSPSSGQGLPAFGAPKVPQPVAADQLSRLTHDPCSVLTVRQVQQLGIPHGQILRSPRLDGDACGWTTPPSVTSTKEVNIVASFSTNGQGLSFFYRNKQINPKGVVVLDNEGTINGFPYIRYETTQSQAFGSCGYDIGVSDQVALDLGIGKRYSMGGDPCQALLQVAKSITSSLKNGG